jgi:predicted TIM-barrel fold metal-dependent hydrolase
MGHTLRLLLVLVVAVAAAVLAQTQAPKAAAPKAQVKYGITVKAGPMDAILLKDYKPDSSLVVPVTRLAKARYPVIDIHSHSSMNVMKTPADVDAWVRRMDEVGVERSVVFTEAVGANFDRQVDLFLKRYPDRFQVWCGMDTANIEAPDYPERAARELERCFRLGARGVGEITDKGWGVQASEAKALPRAKRLRLDDPRLDKFWQKCAELNIPINVHIADHPSCWQPLGPKQERTPDFQGFNLHGKDVPSYEELLLTRDRMLARHPRTRFILCHLSNQGNDLAALAKVLDRYPNAFVDISARDYEIGRSPRAAARFIARYRDRVMFGTDMGWERHMYEAWWRLLETGDEYMPGRIWWRYYGLELPDDLLKSLYRDNALRLLNWSK